MKRDLKKNLPGDDWVNGFAKRNNLSKRAASNIKRSRAAIDKETVNDFFNNLEKVLEEIGNFLKKKIHL